MIIISPLGVDGDIIKNAEATTLDEDRNSAKSRGQLKRHMATINFKRKSQS